MRTWQARLFEPAMTVLVSAALTIAPFSVSRGLAQAGGQTGGTTAPTTPTAPTAPTPGTTTTTPSPGTRPTPQTTTQPQPNISQPPRPIWISGTVVMYDGTEPPASITIERVCGSSPRPEGYTDSKGRFSFSLGQNMAMMADASTDMFSGFGQSNSQSMSASSMGGGMNNSPSESSLWDCELRARLPGFRSSVVSLAGRRSMDNPEVGVIILYPLAGIQGSTVSATSARAPKDARKAYEKGLDNVKKKKLDVAEQEFRKAVELYPKYAAAWLELGKALEKRQQTAEAQQAYASALAADTKFIYPYEQLYQLAFRTQDWKGVVENTDQLLRLNPYEFPGAYYYNSVAHLQLHEFDDAEKMARQAVERDRQQANPKTHYLLGMILVQKQDWTAAATSFRAYLKAAPNASDKVQVERVLTQISQQVSQAQPAPAPTAQQ